MVITYHKIKIKKDLLLLSILSLSSLIYTLGYSKPIFTSNKKKADIHLIAQDTTDTLLIYSAEPNGFVGSLAGGNGLRNLTGQGEQGKENTVFGIDAGKDLTSGKYNTIFGYLAGASLTDDQTNIPFGASPNSATGNVFIGRRVASVAKHALDNTIVGTQAGGNLTDGMDNVLMGIWSGLMIEGGSENVGLGHASLMNIRGYGNFENGNGHRNTAIGDMSARFLNGQIANKTGGKNSIYIGARTTSAGNDVINENVIGYGAEGKGSNTVVIGNDFIESTWISGAPHFLGMRPTSNRPNVFVDPTTGELQKVNINRTNGYQDYTPQYNASSGEFGSEVITKKARYNFDGDTVTFLVDCEITSKGTADGIFIVSLPIPAAGPWTFSAFENNQTGMVLRANAASSELKHNLIDNTVFTTVRVSHPMALGNIISDNRRFIISGSYEAATINFSIPLTNINNSSIERKQTSDTSLNFAIENLKTFPNPIENLLYVENNLQIKQLETIKIYNLSGKLILEKRNPFSNVNYIDVSNLESGHYLVYMGQSIFKIIKK